MRKNWIVLFCAEWPLFRVVSVRRGRIRAENRRDYRAISDRLVVCRSVAPPQGRAGSPVVILSAAVCLVLVWWWRISANGQTYPATFQPVWTTCAASGGSVRDTSTAPGSCEPLRAVSVWHGLDMVQPLRLVAVEGITARHTPTRAGAVRHRHQYRRPRRKGGRLDGCRRSNN